MKTWHLRCLLISLLVSSALTTNSIAAPEQKRDPKLPSMIGIATIAVGSAAHAQATALGEVIKKETGIDVRVIPTDAEKPRINLLRTGGAHTAILAGNAMWNMQLGIEDYATKDWGPQPIQMAWLGPAYIGILTTKSAKDVNEVKDIKGKRVAVMAHRSSALQVEGFLNFGGLTMGDVVKITVPGYIGQFQALLAGQVDVVPIANPVTPKLYEVEAAPKGLKWIPLSRANTTGWEALRKACPYLVPATITFAPGTSKDHPLELEKHGYPFSVYSDADPDLVYTMAKTIGENLDRLHSMAGAWKVFTLEQALATEGLPHVYHEGAIRYFKEKGLWTEKNEEWNQKQLNMQKLLMARWKQHLERAKAENWSAEKLKQAWEEEQEKITGYHVPEE